MLRATRSPAPGGHVSFLLDWQDDGPHAVLDADGVDVGAARVAFPRQHRPSHSFPPYEQEKHDARDPRRVQPTRPRLHERSLAQEGHEGAGGVLRRDVRGDAGAERERRAAPGVGGQDVGGGRDDPRGGHRRVSGRRGG